MLGLCEAWVLHATADRSGAHARTPAFFDDLHIVYLRHLSSLQELSPAGWRGRTSLCEERSNVATRSKWTEIAKAVVQFDRVLKAEMRERGDEDGYGVY